MTSYQDSTPIDTSPDNTEEDHKSSFFINSTHIQLQSLTGESNDFGEEESSQEELSPLREESGSEVESTPRATSQLPPSSTPTSSSEEAFFPEESDHSLTTPEEPEPEVKNKVNIWDQRLRGVTDQEYDKLQALNTKNIEASLHCLLQVHTEENKELQGREVFIGDYLGVRCLHKSTLMYLFSENFEWKWTPDETLAPIITIEPILREPPYSISKLETQKCQDKPNYQWEMKGGKK